MDKKVRNSDIVKEAIGLGALAQLSRNRKINNLGWLGIYVGIVTLIGELIKFPIKWLIFKPFVFCTKIMIVFFKYIFIYGSALFLTISQYTYKGIIMLFEKYKEKKQV